YAFPFEPPLTSMQEAENRLLIPRHSSTRERAESNRDPVQAVNNIAAIMAAMAREAENEGNFIRNDPAALTWAYHTKTPSTYNLHLRQRSKGPFKYEGSPEKYMGVWTNQNMQVLTDLANNTSPGTK